ncbi:hypothetical protein PR048_021399 [Dryococelus australis]|uniref:CCHC-type domain-containing protein n=1 Tax=Dryococelus australis TaxID=614101 RepID=A0ABQ9GY22_9NEOP|nr:hypothetical protein PR048_021399 [Dryococelus australis]
MQLAIEDVQYVGASRGRRQHPPQWGGFTCQLYRETAYQNGALTSKKQEPQNAYSCGVHQSGNVPARRWICYNCGHLGHIAKACRNSSLVCAYASGVLVEPAPVRMKVKGVEILFVVNTGSALTLAVRTSTKKNRGKCLNPVPRGISAADGMGLQVSGVVSMSVTDEGSGSLHKLSLLVARYLSALTLLGRDWLSALQPGLQYHILTNSQVVCVCMLLVPNPFWFLVSINLKGSAIPVFHRAYDVPCDIVQNTKEELYKLEQAGIIYRVKSSPWASLIVVVPKKSYENRLFDRNPLPPADDVFKIFVGCRVFCCLDLTQAYLQLEVEEPCRELLTINNIKGLYRFNRLVFRLTFGPAISQSVIESIQF